MNPDESLSSVDIRCFNVTVSDNIFMNNGVAVYLRQAENSTVSGNTLDGNPVGILSDTDYSTISRNTINDSDRRPFRTASAFSNDLYVFYYPSSPAFYFAWEWAMELVQLEVGGIIVGGNNNIVYGNTVTNSAYNIWLGDIVRNYSAKGNVIFHNNFINCSLASHLIRRAVTSGTTATLPAETTGATATRPTCTVVQAERERQRRNMRHSLSIMSRTPRPYEYDRYPLTVPVNVYEVAVLNGTDYGVDVESNSSVSDFRFNGPSTSFCKLYCNWASWDDWLLQITIPKQVLWINGGQWIVLVNSTQVSCNITEDASYTYFCFYYSHSTEFVQIIGTSAVPEFPSNMILAAIMILTLIVVACSRKAGRRAGGHAPYRICARFEKHLSIIVSQKPCVGLWKRLC